MKSSQRQFICKVDGIEGNFATMTGGSVGAETSKVYDGGDPIPDVLSAPPTAENVSLTRAFDPERDDEIMRQLRQMVGSWVTTVSRTPTDAALIAIAPPTVYSEALLVNLVEPEVDASSGEAAMWGLDFAISHYR